MNAQTQNYDPRETVTQSPPIPRFCVVADGYCAYFDRYDDARDDFYSCADSGEASRVAWYRADGSVVALYGHAN